MLLAAVGLVSGPAAIIQSASPSTSFATALGVVITCLYLWGFWSDATGRFCAWAGTRSRCWS